MEFSMNTDKNDINLAGIIANEYDDTAVKNKVFIQSLGASALKKYLKDCDIEADDSSLYSVRRIFEATDITDVCANGTLMDVRTYSGADALYIPQAHFENNVVPKYYVMAIYNETNSEIVFKGYIPSSKVDKTKKSSNYYVVGFENLLPMEELIQALLTTNNNVKEYNQEEISGLYAALLDGELNKNQELQVIKLLYDSKPARNGLLEFSQFEFLSENMSNFPDLFDNVENEPEEAAVPVLDDLYLPEETNMPEDILFEENEDLETAVNEDDFGEEPEALEELAETEETEEIEETEEAEEPEELNLQELSDENTDNVDALFDDDKLFDEEQNEIPEEDSELLPDETLSEQDMLLNEEENYETDDILTLDDEPVLAQENEEIQEFGVEDDLFADDTELNLEENEEIKEDLITDNFDNSDVEINETEYPDFEDDSVSVSDNNQEEHVAEENNFYEKTEDEIFDTDIDTISEDTGNDSDVFEIVEEKSNTSEITEDAVKDNEYDYSDLNSILDELQSSQESDKKEETEAAVQDITFADENTGANAETDNGIADLATNQNIETLYEESSGDVEESNILNPEDYYEMSKTKSSSSLTKVMVPVVSVCVLAAVFAGGFYKFKGKYLANSTNTVSDVQMKSIDDFDDETFLEKDLNNSQQNANGGENAIMPNPDAIDASDINQSMSNIFDDTVYPVMISKIAWEIPEVYTTSSYFKKYLQIAGVQVQRDLQANLANVKEISETGKIKVSFDIDENSVIKNIKIMETSGSKEIDTLVEKSLKTTLSYIKVPVIPSSENFVNLTLVINF